MRVDLGVNLYGPINQIAAIIDIGSPNGRVAQLLVRIRRTRAGHRIR